MRVLLFLALFIIVFEDLNAQNSSVIGSYYNHSSLKIHNETIQYDVCIQIFFDSNFIFEEYYYQSGNDTIVKLGMQGKCIMHNSSTNFFGKHFYKDIIPKKGSTVKIDDDELAFLKTALIRSFTKKDTSICFDNFFMQCLYKISSNKVMLLRKEFKDSNIYFIKNKTVLGFPGECVK